MDSINQIVNFTLNISLWQTINKGYYHKLSIHIQDIIPDFVINWIVVDNGHLLFEGVNLKTHKRDEILDSKDIDPKYLKEVLNILKNINLFHS